MWGTGEGLVPPFRTVGMKLERVCGGSIGSSMCVCVLRPSCRSLTARRR